MKTAIMMVLAVLLTASLAFAQAGPKQKEKAKKKKSKTEKKVEAPEKAEPAAPKPVETPAPPEKAPPPPTQPAKTKKGGPLARAVFTSGIDNREPVDQLDSLSTEALQVFFYTELVGLRGHTVTHRWTYQGEIKAEVPIMVKSSHWRAYSSKKLLPGWTGDWTVEVIDSSGTVLGTHHLVYH